MARRVLRPVNRSRHLAVAWLALVASGLALGAHAEPVQRPTFEDRLRLIRSHGRLPAFLAPPPLPASGQDDFDVTHYDLTIAPSAWESRVDGSVTVSFRPSPDISALDELVLDFAGNMTVLPDGVSRRSLPGVVLPFTHVGDVVRIDLTVGGAVPSGQVESVTVKFEGQPRQDNGGGLQFSIFGRFPTHVPSIYSLSQPYLARTWWPCKDRPDDKATVTVRVDAPSQWQAVSNGTLVSVTPSGRDGNVISAWRTRVPIPTYLVALAVSEYATCHAEYVSPLDPSIVTPLTYWAWPSRIDDACDRWDDTPVMMDVFARRFGEYPFADEKYDHVAVSPPQPLSPYIAMENATCSFFGRGWLSLSHDSLMAHELAHHWWGNSVTPTDFRSLWLNEGFATWSEALWWESQYGLSEYLGTMRDLDPLRMTGEFAGPVHDPIDLDGDGWPDGNASDAELTVYFKGAWVLHMLRWVIGQQDQGASTTNMDRLLTAWHESRARGVASTQDFVSFADQMATEEFGQRDGLLWFFDQWLHREDRPCYRYGWTSVPGMDGGWDLQVVAEQGRYGLDEDTGVLTCADEIDEPYRMPVALRVDLSTGERLSLNVDSRERQQSWLFRLPSRPTVVVWDPDGWILKSTQVVDVDADGDGWADPFDSCPLVPNPDQMDANGNGLGDACEPGLDFDGDGILNEEDCAPADPWAWSHARDLAPIDVFVAKQADGLAVWHGDVQPLSGFERPHVIDVALGRLDRLQANDSFRDASCVEMDRQGIGQLVIPWAEIPGAHYVVMLPYNGCGPVDASGRLDNPCR